MLSFSSAPDIVVIFERHWDMAPKQVLKHLIPGMAEEGYDTLCFEFPHDVPEHKILPAYHKDLEFNISLNSQAENCLKKVGIINSKLCNVGFKQLAYLMEQYVSSKKYIEFTEKIKQLPASILLMDIFNISYRLSLRIKGVDIPTISEITDSNNMLERRSILEKVEKDRIATFSENLFTLHRKGKGLIFICGVFHAENLISKFKERNLDDHVLYYFPHSNKNYNDEIDDVKTLFCNETLKNHTFRLIDEDSCKLLANRIVKEVKLKNTHYKEEITDENSHSIFLSSFFQKNFRTFMRPGYYVDALLDIDESKEDVEKIKEKLNQVNISTHEKILFDRKHLVIQDINTKTVGDNIRRLN